MTFIHLLPLGAANTEFSSLAIMLGQMQEGVPYTMSTQPSNLLRHPAKRNHSRSQRLVLTAVLAVLTLAACIPIGIPGLRNLHGQTWAARFDVQANIAGATIRLPVDVALKFSQNLQNVDAEATIEYDAGILRLQTGRLVQLNGRIGLDDHLSLDSSSNVLAFDGSFVGDRLVGTVSIAGVVPVGQVTFTRIR